MHNSPEAALADIVEKIEEDLIELVILAEYAARQQKPPKAKAYELVIDQIKKTVHVHGMLGREILGLVDKKPEEWALQLKEHGGRRVRIEPDQFVEFHAHHIERFETSPKCVRNGEAPQKPVLTTDDTDFLNTLGLTWEIQTDPNAGQAVVVKDYALPAGANRERADLMIRLPATYPAAALDMFHLPPGIGRADGRPLPALSPLTFANTPWIQWSRHRDQTQPWRPGIDCLATHFALVEKALIADLA